jgi:hypothetical protein
MRRKGVAQTIEPVIAKIVVQFGCAGLLRSSFLTRASE